MFLVSGNSGIVDGGILSTVSFILWIPFVLVALSSGLILAITGYKNGFWRALIAFAATILSAVISMFLGNWLGQLISPAVVSGLPLSEIRNVRLIGRLLSMLVEAVFSNVIALALFSILFLILTIILRGISHKIAPGKLLPKGKLSKLCGMAIGLVCALVYTLLLLLPLYGSISVYAPVAAKLVAMDSAGGQDADLFAYTDALTQHPVVKMTGAAPIAAVYRTTTQITVGDGNDVSVASLATTAQNVVDLLEQIRIADESQRSQLCNDLIYMLRTEIADQPWLYDVFIEAKEMLTEEFDAQDLDPASAMVYEALFAQLDMTRDDFNTNISAILDFALYALENDGYNTLRNENYEGLYKGEIILRAGQLANVTEQAVGVKNLIWVSMATEFLGSDTQPLISFMSKYPLPRLTNDDELYDEAEALMCLMGFNGEPSIAEFVLRHPSLGESVLQELIDTYGFNAVLGIEDTELGMEASQNSSLQRELLDRVQEAARQPLNGNGFLDQVRFEEAIITLAKNGYWCKSSYVSPVEVQNVLKLVSKSDFTARSGGDHIYSILSAFPKLDTSKYQPNQMAFMDGVSDIWCVIEAIVDGNMPTSTEEYSYTDIGYSLDSSILDDGLVATMEQMNNGGTDPLGLGNQMSSAQRQALRAYVEDRINSISGGGDYVNSITIITNPDDTNVFAGVASSDGGFSYDMGGMTISSDSDIYNEFYSTIYGYDDTYFSAAERISIVCNFFGV